VDTTEQEQLSPTKQKLQLVDGPPLPNSSVPSDEARPKSKKELRAERKKARRVAEDPEFLTTLQQVEQRAADKEQEREELRRLIREERNEKKIRQLKKQNREQNAPGRGHDVEKKHQNNEPSDKRASKKAKTTVVKGDPAQEDDVAQKVINEIKYGTSDSSGWTTLQLGVKYKDVVVGKGPEVPNKSLVTVKYQLTGGKFGAVIDSSKNFKFRLGKGEVVQGWEIGLQGMREGGQRKLVVPPKAGYGSQDIGAGPGGLLYFDVTLLSFR
jgi:FKBP-type peptidyl-prolyl cis-trans isomerase